MFYKSPTLDFNTKIGFIKSPVWVILFDKKTSLFQGFAAICYICNCQKPEAAEVFQIFLNKDLLFLFYVRTAKIMV